MHEFDLVERIRQRARCLPGSAGNSVQSRREDVLLGIGDDAALLQPAPGMQLAMTTDTLVRSVHYPPDTTPADLGWKALAASLSDLAAMGAEPLWALLALTLPEARSAWIDAFMDGWCALAEPSGVVLVGGDSTCGPEAVNVTLVGQVPSGAALLRSGACTGDRVWVTGTLGDAAAALRMGELFAGSDGTAAATERASVGEPAGQALPVSNSTMHDTCLRLDRDSAAWLQTRLRRPTPRLSFARRLRGLATACVDVSDGLLADLGHVLAASGVAAELSLAAVPALDALARLPPPLRWPLQLAGGDDYELCFTAPVSRDDAIRSAAAGCGLSATPIGRVIVGSGVRVLHEDGSEYHPPRSGYRHFD